MPFKHGNIFRPLASAEVAQDIGHLDVVLIGAGLSHGGSIGSQAGSRNQGYVNAGIVIFS